MAMPALPFVTAFYAALTGLLCVLLASLVIRQRFRSRVSLGDGGDAAMNRMSRVFGNFAEYAALVLVLLALIEINGGSRVLVHALGIGFIVARLAHLPSASPRTADTNPGRATGILLTLLVIVVASVALLVIVARKIFV
jgi:uncharacterized membrane protein YecN with MAPEG domain